MTYHEWRATVPYTDEQIATALENSISEPRACDKPAMRGMVQRLHARRAMCLASAEYLRKTGRLTAKMLYYAGAGLAKTCRICGKPAFYRYGADGRCEQHKTARPAWFVQQQARQTAHRDGFARFLQEKDQQLRVKDGLRALHTGRQAQKA